MSKELDRIRAITGRLGGKHRTRRRGPHRPSWWLGQFSLAALLLLTTAASVLLAVSHYRGAEIRRSLDHLERRAASDARTFHQTPADEFVPVAAVLLSGLLGAAIGWGIYRLPADRGLYVVWALACLAVVGLVVAICLPVRPLANTELHQLHVTQLLPAVLWGLRCLLPLCAAVGWYLKFTGTNG